MTNKQPTVTEIKRWMQRHVANHVDDCGEVNTTSLTEAWDSACADGESTLDPDHPAWDVAVSVGEAFEKARRRQS